jgi:two-component system nitrogen regulation response regulator GlnG
MRIDCVSPKLTLPDPEGNQEIQDTPEEGLPLKEIMQRRIVVIEREILVHVLRETGGNKAKAARLLHIDYKTIHSKVRQYGIPID